MEKFLEHHKLINEHESRGECFLVKVKDSSEILIDELVCYCLFDVKKVIEFYLKPDGRFWYTVSVLRL